MITKALSMILFLIALANAANSLIAYHFLIQPTVNFWLAMATAWGVVIALTIGEVFEKKKAP